MICLAAAVALAGRGGGVVRSGGPPAKARVVMVEDAQATSAFEPQPAIVQDMVNRAMLKLTGKEDIVQAWRSIVSTQDVVGLKVYCAPGPTSGTRPGGGQRGGARSSRRRTAPAQHRHLGQATGRFARGRIRRVGAALRCAAGRQRGQRLRRKGLLRQGAAGRTGSGDLEFDKYGAKTGRKSYVSKLLTGDMTKIITITPLLNHNVAGVTGNLYSLATGSVDNIGRFESQAARLAEAVPEIYALPALSDHVALSITDALIGQYQGENMSLLHYSNALNQIWMSKDPVALDVLAMQELDREREARKMSAGNPNAELYHNAWHAGTGRGRSGQSAGGFCQVESRPARFGFNFCQNQTMYRQGGARRRRNGRAGGRKKWGAPEFALELESHSDKIKAMSQGLHLSQRMSLSQVLAPQLQQSLALLQAPTLELKALVEQEVQMNPCLEEVPTAEMEQIDRNRDEGTPANDPARPGRAAGRCDVRSGDGKAEQRAGGRFSGGI